MKAKGLHAFPFGEASIRPSEVSYFFGGRGYYHHPKINGKRKINANPQEIELVLKF